MRDIVLDNVPDELYERIRQRAERNGRTADDEARALLIDSIKGEAAELYDLDELPPELH